MKTDTISPRIQLQYIYIFCCSEKIHTSSRYLLDLHPCENNLSDISYWQEVLTKSTMTYYRD